MCWIKLLLDDLDLINNLQSPTRHTQILLVVAFHTWIIWNWHFKGAILSPYTRLKVNPHPLYGFFFKPYQQGDVQDGEDSLTHGAGDISPVKFHLWVDELLHEHHPVLPRGRCRVRGSERRQHRRQSAAYQPQREQPRLGSHGPDGWRPVDSESEPKTKQNQKQEASGVKEVTSEVWMRDAPAKAC